MKDTAEKMDLEIFEFVFRYEKTIVILAIFGIAYLFLWVVFHN
jgi:hypothetical protein